MNKGTFRGPDPIVEQWRGSAGFAVTLELYSSSGDSSAEKQKKCRC